MTVPLDVIATITAHQQVDDDLLAKVLHALIAERHTAYQAGRRDERQLLREASISIRKNTDWHQLINDTDDATAKRARRAILLDPRPRPGDHPGRDT